MGVKRDNVPFAGVHEGTESPKKVAKAAKRTFAAGLDLLSLKQSKLQIHNCGVPDGTDQNVGTAFCICRRHFSGLRGSKSRTAAKRGFAALLCS